MKPLPLAIFVCMALPIMVMPSVQGEGNFIYSKIETPLGDIDFSTFMDDAWDWVVGKITGIADWIGNGIIGILETIKGWHQYVLNALIGNASSEGMMTINLLMAVGYILLIFALIRIWVWALDVAPIA